MAGAVKDSFYDAGALRQIATNLFYGWGYNFYRKENQLRADDQMVRSKAASLLGEAMAAVCAAESDYRRAYLPAPTRAKPFPDAECVGCAQKLEQLGKAIGAVEAQIQHQPVPENDRMTQRYRKEAPTLAALAESDKTLIGQAELLRTMLDGKNGAAIVETLSEAQDGVAAIGETLRKRQLLLFPA